MSSTNLPSAESSFVEAYARNTELRAKIEEASLVLLQEISERQGRLEMALMRDAASSNVEHSGATGRLDVLNLKVAELTAIVNRLELLAAKRESSLLQIANNTLTIQRQVNSLARRQMPWYEWFYEKFKRGRNE